MPAAIGLKVKGSTVDREGVAKFKTDVVNANVGGVKTLFKANNVQFMYGDATFKSPTEIVVKTKEGGTENDRGQNVVIATGSAPIDVKAWPRDGETIINSDDAVQLQAHSRRTCSSSAAASSASNSQPSTRAWARTCSSSKRCRRFSPEPISKSRRRSDAFSRSRASRSCSTPKSASSKRDGKSVKATFNGEGTGGKDETREFDMVLVAVGRRPVTDTLDLASRRPDDRRQRLHRRSTRSCRTKVPNVFAIGDVTGQPLLAHRAMKQGVVAAEVIAGDKSAAFDPVAIPNCVYTDPEVATVGLSEEEAKAKGYEVRIGKFPLAASGRARTMNETDGVIKLVGDAKSDLLLGMHIVAPQAESLIGEGVIALEMGATLEDIGLSIHPHPTLTEGIMDAAEAAHGKAIHIVNPKPEGPGRRQISWADRVNRLGGGSGLRRAWP